MHRSRDYERRMTIPKENIPVPIRPHISVETLVTLSENAS